jgi:hypothetical protein
MPKLKKEIEEVPNGLLDAVEEELIEERVEIPRKEIVAYRAFYIPSMTKPIEIRKLKYSEIKQLNEFNTDNMDEVYDKLILACTNLTIQSIELMPQIERLYFLSYLRSISFINGEFEITAECHNTECDLVHDIKLGLDQLEFIEPPEEFNEAKEVRISNDTFKINYRLEIHKDSLVIENLDLEKYDSDIVDIVSSIESISLNEQDVITCTTNEKCFISAVEFLEENGELAMWIINDLEKYDYGIKGVTKKWTCKCGHKNESEINPEIFFFPTDI